MEAIWNQNLKDGGPVFAEETNKAYHAISEDVQWVIYIQGGVVHEIFAGHLT